MPNATARIETDQPSQYLVHLCQHATKVSHLHDGGELDHPKLMDVEWTDTTGDIRLNCGTCTLHAEGNTLVVHAEAPDQAGLKRVQDIITADLQRFGRRDQLFVGWSGP
jgi:hypothetical protein